MDHLNVYMFVVWVENPKFPEKDAVYVENLTI